jgi:hypothetical protein
MGRPFRRVSKMLSEFLKYQMSQQGLKTADVVKRSGKRISASNINKIVADLSGVITVKTADAIAKGLRVPLIDVVQAALNEEVITTTPSIIERILRTYNQLPDTQRPQADYLLSVVERELERLLDSAVSPDS